MYGTRTMLNSHVMSCHVSQSASCNTAETFANLWILIRFSIGLLFANTQVLKAWKIVYEKCDNYKSVHVQPGTSRIFKFRLEDYFFTFWLKKKTTTKQTNKQRKRNHGKCESPRFIGSRESCPTPTAQVAWSTREKLPKWLILSFVSSAWSADHSVSNFARSVWMTFFNVVLGRLCLTFSMSWYALTSP